MHHLDVSPTQLRQALFEASPLIEQVFALADELSVPVCLVGGTVRDILLGRPTHDLDFCVDGDGLRLARALADRLGGAYVTLDHERGTGRVLLPQGDRERGQTAPVSSLDLASLRAGDLTGDLADRDFTVNAIAIGHGPSGALCVFDPLHGRRDLQQRTLRAASAHTFRSDPVRTLRAVRLSNQLGLAIEPETRAALRAAAHLLAGVSPERIRDEWFKILAEPHAAHALRVAHRFALLELVAPPLARLSGSEPHAAGSLQDALDHALDTVDAIERLYDALRSAPSVPGVDLAPELVALGPDLVRRYAARIL